MNSLLSWENIIENKYQSDLCPLLYFIITKALPKLNVDKLHHTNPNDSIVPDTVLAVLEKHYQASLLRNMILLEELKRVLTELENHDIRAVVLKGGYLAENVYDNIACRPMGDLDILISQNSREQCYRILRDKGYNFHQDSQENETLHFTFIKEICGMNVVFELHHRIAKTRFLTNFDVDEVFSYNYMPLEYQLVYLAWHGTRHGQSRILWLCDIAELIKKNRNLIKWNLVLQKSGDFNVNKQLTCTLYLTNNMLFPQLPNKENNAANYMVGYIISTLFFRMQNKVLNRKDIKILRYLFGLFLTERKHLGNRLINDIQYMCSNHLPAQCEKDENTITAFLA
jgi:uncharacterized protein (UPF0297 family)